MAIAAALVVSVPSRFLSERYATRAVAADQQLAILEGRPFTDAVSGGPADVPEFRSRVLGEFDKIPRYLEQGFLHELAGCPGLPRLGGDGAAIAIR